MVKARELARETEGTCALSDNTLYATKAWGEKQPVIFKPVVVTFPGRRPHHANTGPSSSGCGKKPLKLRVRGSFLALISKTLSQGLG